MAYADYSYYTTTFLGTAIASSDFSRLALRASAVIDQITFGRAADDTTNVNAIKNAMCAVAEEIQTIDQSTNADYVTSESQGRYSVTYHSSVVDTRTDTQRHQDAAKVWLANTGLLFAGFNTVEYGGLIDT